MTKNRATTAPDGKPTPVSGEQAKGEQAKRLHSAVIADELEAEIIDGRLAPGTRLDEQALTERFGVSRTPVREALHELASRALAERVPYRGVLVAEITRERVDALFETMGEIEATCGRLAAERMTVSERAALEDLHQTMSRLAEAGKERDYELTNTAFHTAIFEGTHNLELIEVANALRLKLAPFRKSQLKATERMQRSNEEHAAILAAIIDRDGRKAEKALRRHLMSAAKAVLAKMA